MKLLETAHDVILIVDAETGDLLEVNHATEELFGRPREELRGLHQTDLHPPDEREYYERVFKEHAGSSGMIHDKRELSVVHADGYEIPVEISAASLDWATDGWCRGFSGTYAKGAGRGSGRQ